MKRRLICAGLLLSVPALTDAACENFWNAHETNSLVAFLDKIDNSSSSWRSFKITNYPIVITDAKNYQTCAVIYTRGRVANTMTLSSELLQPVPIDLEQLSQSIPKDIDEKQRQDLIQQIKLRFSQPFEWGFIDPNLPNISPAPPIEFNDALFKLGYFSAIAVSLHSLKENIERLVSTIAHEGFHHFYQGSERQIDNRSHYQWPTWSHRLADTSSTVEQCYNSNQDVADIHETELRTLLDATISAQLGKRPQAIEMMIRFLELRMLRRKQVEENPVKSRNSGEAATNCDFAEESLELVEGSAQFVGLDALIKSGLLSPETFANRIEAANQSSESWYRSGALQLLFAKTILNEADFENMLSRIERSSDSHRGLTYEIQSIVAP